MNFSLIAILLLIAVAVGGVWLAFSAFKRESKSYFVYYGEGFSAGIFLGASLLHMLPDALHNLRDVHSAWVYPLAALVCAIGFLVLYAIEQVSVHLLNKKDDHLSSSGLTYLLLVILSIHSVLVGVSLGLEASFAAATIIMLALLVHKATAGYALGVSMVRSRLSVFARAAMTAVFALSTPLGVLAGFTILQVYQVQVQGLAEGLFDAIAAGTFLFMAMHFSQTQISVSNRSRLGSVLALIIGFIVMAVLALYL